MQDAVQTRPTAAHLREQVKGCSCSLGGAAASRVRLESLFRGEIAQSPEGQKAAAGLSYLAGGLAAEKQMIGQFSSQSRQYPLSFPSLTAISTHLNC